MLIQPSKIVTGDLLPELPKPEYKALRALKRAMQTRNWEVVNVLIRLGVYLWQTRTAGRCSNVRCTSFGQLPHASPGCLL